MILETLEISKNASISSCHGVFTQFKHGTKSKTISRYQIINLLKRDKSEFVTKPLGIQVAIIFT